MIFSSTPIFVFLFWGGLLLCILDIIVHSIAHLGRLSGAGIIYIIILSSLLLIWIGIIIKILLLRFLLLLLHVIRHARHRLKKNKGDIYLYLFIFINVIKILLMIIGGCYFRYGKSYLFFVIFQNIIWNVGLFIVVSIGNESYSNFKVFTIDQEKFISICYYY